MSQGGPIAKHPFINCNRLCARAGKMGWSWRAGPKKSKNWRAWIYKIESVFNMSFFGLTRQKPDPVKPESKAGRPENID